MELTQIISILSISALTIVAVVIGIQLIILLKEAKNTLAHYNRVLDSVETTVDKISQPINGFATLVEGVRQSGKVVDLITGFLDRRRTPPPPVHFDDDERPY